VPLNGLKKFVNGFLRNFESFYRAFKRFEIKPFKAWKGAFTRFLKEFQQAL
jgi:hypothetical protein